MGGAHATEEPADAGGGAGGAQNDGRALSSADDARRTPARSRYWDDPLNKAVMRAWQSGIVVVVSAGNSGPLPQTVGVPGNVPYVITVGAMTDNYTTNNKTDDRLATFSPPVRPSKAS